MVLCLSTGTLNRITLAVAKLWRSTVAPRFKGKSLPFPLGPDHAAGVIQMLS